MDRRAFITMVSGGIVAAPLAVEAQPSKIPRVGVLGGQSPAIISSPPVFALRQGLSELGYVEGQNIAFEWRWAGGKLERFPGLATELVNLKVDIIVAATPPGVEAAQRATRTIPIVMAFVSDPVALGFVASLARPGGNTTGLGVPSAEIVGKRLQLLREAVPTVAGIAVLSDPSQLGSSAEVRAAETAAEALGMPLQILEARSADELERAFSAVRRKRTAGVVLLQGTTLFAHRAYIAQLAAKYRLPTSVWTRDGAEAGCLMSYGANNADAARRAAAYVDKILKGAKPGDLPVEQPTKFELVINLKTAKALGLTIPPSVLGRADEIIQ